jgi:2-polyprenyl-6-methoxyphenol hydroxylase-like FAD-dependent oxidoreductase
VQSHGQESGPRQVVIAGAGLAGLFPARELRRAPVQVTLRDRAVASPVQDHPTRIAALRPTGDAVAAVRR